MTTIFSKRLRELREEKGLSQRAFGKMALGKGPASSTYINQWEKGSVNPSIFTILDLAKKLKIPASYFLEENDTIAKAIILMHTLSSVWLGKLMKELEIE